jgi:hypothetical protein
MASRNINVLSIAALPVITDGDDTCRRKANIWTRTGQGGVGGSTGGRSSSDASADLVLIMIDTDPQTHVL